MRAVQVNGVASALRAEAQQSGLFDAWAAQARGVSLELAAQTPRQAVFPQRSEADRYLEITFGDEPKACLRGREYPLDPDSEGELIRDL